jgi:hypothetical protein
MKVTYHDPCHLGRQGETYVPWNGKEKKIFGQAVVYDPPRPRYNGAFGVYEPPRNVLRRFPGWSWWKWNASSEAAWCCGAGGGAREAYPEFSQLDRQGAPRGSRSDGSRGDRHGMPLVRAQLPGCLRQGRREAESLRRYAVGRASL